MAETGNALRRLERADRALDPEVPLFLLSRGVIRILRAHAPVRTGNLKAGIGIVDKKRGNYQVIGVDLGATARRPNKVQGPSRPFDYVAITRFGHKVAVIYPKQLREDASVVSTKRSRKKGRRGRLAIPVGGGLIFRSSVKGYRPKSDWVADAGPDIEVETARVTLAYKRRLDAL